jgi:hydroxymethylbilane synthase
MPVDSKNIIRIGTRGSMLALYQANYIKDQIHKKKPDTNIEIVKITTSGDKDQKSDLSKIGGIGVFTKKIERELLDCNIDIAVHSAKDLPSVMTEGLTLAAIPDRGYVEDTVVCPPDNTFNGFTSGMIVGTGSPRRATQIKYLQKDIIIKPIRGNIETRLNKLDEAEYDIIVMARAALNRLKLENRISEILDPDRFIPAAGQGAIAVQTRADDKVMIDLAGLINNPDTKKCLTIERLLLEKLNAGCSTPIGCWARIEKDNILFSAVVLDNSGAKRLFSKYIGELNTDNESLAESVKNDLIKQGAGKLIGGTDD